MSGWAPKEFTEGEDAEAQAAAADVQGARCFNFHLVSVSIHVAAACIMPRCCRRTRCTDVLCHSRSKSYICLHHAGATGTQDACSARVPSCLPLAACLKFWLLAVHCIHRQK
jgi:hypothetical protein